MRSVVFIFAGSANKKAEKLLNEYCHKSAVSENQWIVLCNDDPCLYISRVNPEHYDEYLLDIEFNDSIEMFFNDNSGFNILNVDISNRHNGTKELTDLISALFSSVSGYVIDDYTGHLWTEQEIREGVLIKGHTFFDFNGWYNESQQISVWRTR